MKYLDLVICGPDMSGTGTQIVDTISYLKSRKLGVRDMRGTELDALFHAEIFKEINRGHRSLSDFMHDKKSKFYRKANLLMTANRLLSLGGTNADLKIASCVQNQSSTYVDPKSADAWIFEEPTKRGAGQVNRTIEQQRSQYASKLDPIAAAYCHQVYRIDEFLRFRKPLREANKIIVRSRSEESACYQIFDKRHLVNGIPKKIYLNLPGHKLAFAHAPTHIFVVCAPANWTKAEYIEMRQTRSGAGRALDDHEKNAEYMLLVNRRYASDWLEKLYEKGTKIHGGRMPKIYRFNIYDSKDAIRTQMQDVMQKILRERKQL